MKHKPHSIKTDKTLGEFKAWLKSLPPETKFCESLRVCSCPIAKFTGIETWLLDAPDWANKFMRAFDIGSNYGRNDTVERAVAIADTL